MFSSLSALSSGASTSSSSSSSSTSSAAAKILDATQNQNLEERIPLTSKEEVEGKLASILTQIKQNQIKCLNLTPASSGRFYELANTLSGHQSWISSLVTLKNVGDMASGSGYLENPIKLRDLTSNSCLATLQKHTEAVLALAVLPNGQLASSSDDTTIKLWNLASCFCLATLQGHTDAVWALTVLPNGQLASSSGDHTIKLWNLASYSYLATLQEHTDSVETLTVLPNGHLASGSADKTIKIWNLDSHSCLATLQGHTDTVCAFAALPNGQLASGSWDNTIKLWDLVSNSCLATLQGHTSFVNALITLPNGHLASGSFDKTIKIWDLDSHSCLATLQGHTDTVCTLAALPNGLLASGSFDKTIKLWELRTLSARQLQPILNALKNNTLVTDLDLAGNRDILDDLIDPLISIFTPGTSSGLKPNTTLKTIDLRKTGVSQKGMKKLKKALQRQRLSIDVLSDCPPEWMMIYFLIIFCRANRNSPFAESGLDLCKYGEIGPFLGVPSGFFMHPRKNSSFSKYTTPSPIGSEYMTSRVTI